MVLGAGPGLAEVLRILREDQIRPTAIVSIAYDTEEKGFTGEPIASTAVDDLRSSLEALAPEDGALLRAIRRPLAIGNVGRQRLGNLVIGSIAHGFGDYAQASMWLGERLGIAGAVLPATVGPVQRRIDTSDGMPPRRRAARLSFVGGSLRSPRAAVTAIEHAEWVLLAPGSLYRSVIATAAVPDVARALRTTPAPVLWIASPEPESSEPAGPIGIEELQLLRSHGIRVDAVLYDSQAMHGFDRGELLSCGVEAIPRPLRSSRDLARGDPERLRRALAGVIRSPSSATTGGAS
ncbi:MAG: gluconeogenesis factor YvcK family protein [Solirubrobacteraceae bacterium]